MAIDIQLDLKGKVCPMPAAETRKALKKVEAGTVIEIIGDFEPALENVIKMAQKQGAEVLEQEEHTKYYRVVVKK